MHVQYFRVKRLDVLLNHRYHFIYSSLIEKNDVDVRQMPRN